MLKIDLEHDRLWVVTKFFPKNVETAHIQSIGFDAQANLNVRLLRESYILYLHRADISAVNITAILRHRPYLEQTILAVFRLPPIWCEQTTLATEVCRARPAANLYAVYPYSDIGGPVQVMKWSFRADFSTEIETYRPGS